MVAARRRIWRELDHLAEAFGFTFDGLTGGDHRRYVAPNGATVITPSTPSGRRALVRARTKFRNAIREHS